MSNPFEQLSQEIREVNLRLINIENAIAVLNPPDEEKNDRCDFREALIETELSESSLRKLCMTKSIPFQKYGRKIVFSRKALQEWKQERTVSPVTDSEVMGFRLSRSANKKLVTA